MFICYRARHGLSKVYKNSLYVNCKVLRIMTINFFSQIPRSQHCIFFIFQLSIFLFLLSIFGILDFCISAFSLHSSLLCTQQFYVLIMYVGAFRVYIPWVHCIKTLTLSSQCVLDDGGEADNSTQGCGKFHLGFWKIPPRVRGPPRL